MNKQKILSYATLIGLTALVNLPYQAQAKKEDKNPNAFYFTEWTDLNGDGKHQFSECKNAYEIKPTMTYKYISDDLFLYLNPQKGYKPEFENIVEEGGEMKLELVTKNSDEEIYKLHSDKVGNAYKVKIYKRRLDSYLGWGIPSNEKK